MVGMEESNVSTANNNKSDQGVVIARASKALPRRIKRIALCFDGATPRGIDGNEQ